MVEPPPVVQKPHACLTAALVMTSLLLLDAYLLEQDGGPWRMALYITVVAGDGCFLVMLRYVVVWAESEVHTARRGYAMILWFFYIFVLEIKVYFIYQSYKSQGEAVMTDVGVSRGALTLLLSLCVPIVFITLAAIDHLEYLQSHKKREEMRSRLFWVVLDLLDVVDVQANLWERQRGGLPLWVEGLMFFYCYILLLLLPCVSLSEISMQGVNIVPHKMLLYPILSLATINVATLLIRGGNLLLYSDLNVSGIMMGKNVIAIVVKSCSLLEYGKQRLASPPADRGGEDLRTPLEGVQVSVSHTTVLPRVIIEDFTTVWEEEEEREKDSGLQRTSCSPQGLTGVQVQTSNPPPPGLTGVQSMEASTVHKHVNMVRWWFQTVPRSEWLRIPVSLNKGMVDELELELQIHECS
ncbi:transmembrane protein 121-like [Cololabis saira]|uniref:transmembrane protein 121-like n=1 Tax=Cololabis saira TaxID=129043 RepID=UPI002AD4DF2E|nr:transmembrane protein 121-like [Cololabis saira]